MNVVPLTLMTRMMGHKINSVVIYLNHNFSSERFVAFKDGACYCYCAHVLRIL